MKNRNHFVDLYQYNPNNIKEELCVISFKVTYVPMKHKKWNWYSILINNKFCGINFNINDIVERGGRISPRSIILQSIKNYLDTGGNRLEKSWRIYSQYGS